MRFQLAALTAPLALLFALTAPADAGPTPSPGATPPPITGITMSAPVFPYGAQQSFTVGGIGNGKICNASAQISINKGSLQNVLVADIGISGTLPFSSGNALKLPSSNGQNYTVQVFADPGSPGCSGWASATFGVEPQIGQITGLKTSTPVVAANQPITFTVAGQSYGYCNYTGKVVFGGGDVVAGPLTVSQLPFQTTASFSMPGPYVGYADEIDVSGRPEGCTGHLQLPFTVISLPSCAGGSPYQSADDSEYGCLISTANSYSIPLYSCPTGYSSFQTTLTGSIEYGCRKNGVSPLALTAITGLVGVTPKSNGNGFLGAAGVALPATPPTITNVQFVDVGPSGAWRPNSGIFYAGEDFQVNVVGNIQNNGGYDPTPCGYKVDVQSVSSGKVISSSPFTAFNIDDLGAIASPGAYNIIVKPFAPPDGKTPACLGKAERTVNVLYETAWVTGFNLYAFGYHFNAADNGGLPQFCSACTSIFSPAHNSAFLEVIPQFQGTTSTALQWSTAYKGACVASVVLNGPNFSGNNGGTGGNWMTFQNGGASMPAPDSSNLNANSTPPYWTQWDGDTNTVQVQIQSPSFADVQYMAPPCNVLGTLSKTITFTDNPKAPPVSK